MYVYNPYKDANIYTGHKQPAAMAYKTTHTQTLFATDFIIILFLWCLCAECMDGYFKAGVGNDPCMPCPPSQVSTQDRTDCMCEENRGGGDCSGEVTLCW